MEFETFVTQVIDQSGSLRVTVPSRLGQYMGIKPGDTVKVMIQKRAENEPE